MISLEWADELTGESREELRRLLAEAAEADALAGFPSFGLDDPVPDGTRYLLIWLLPDERSGRAEDDPALAGCLRLEPRSGGSDGSVGSGGSGRSGRSDGAGGSGGQAEMRLVVRPEFRSRGISTLLCERIGLDAGASGGWAGTGAGRLYCWARGNHPAAQRLALRFGSSTDPAGLRRTRREWRLVVPLSPEADLETLDGLRELPPEVAAELLERADEPGYDAESALDKALGTLREQGALIGSYTVDDRQHTVLSACRSLGFRHDRTDARYDLG